jgi:hypothetical protein
MSVFPHDLAYEQYISGPLKGKIKYAIRVGLLKYVRPFAIKNMVYMAGALCSSAK